MGSIWARATILCLLLGSAYGLHICKPPISRTYHTLLHTTYDGVGYTGFSLARARSLSHLHIHTLTHTLALEKSHTHIYPPVSYSASAITNPLVTMYVIPRWATVKKGMRSNYIPCRCTISWGKFPTRIAINIRRRPTGARSVSHPSQCSNIDQSHP